MLHLNDLHCTKIVDALRTREVEYRREAGIRVLLGEQNLLDQAFQLRAHPLGQLLFKEFLALGKVQLKMADAEDF